MKKILDCCIYNSIQIKNGNNDFINAIIKNIKNAGCQEEDMLYSTKYSIRYDYKFVNKYLLYSYYNEEEVINILKDLINKKKVEEKQIKEKEKQQQLSLHRLWQWWDMEDEEVKECLSKLENELKQNQYRINNIKDIIVILKQLENAGFNVDIEYYRNLIKDNINVDEEIGNIDVLNIYTDNKEFKKEYDQLIEPILNILNNKIYEDNINRINDCFKYDDRWGEEFYEYCTNNRDNLLLDKKFFFYIDIDKLEEFCSKADVKNLAAFLAGLKKVYNFGNLNEFFKNDTANIENFLSKIENIKKLNSTITRKLRIDDINRFLVESLELIKQ